MTLFQDMLECVIFFQRRPIMQLDVKKKETLIKKTSGSMCVANILNGDNHVDDLYNYD